MAAYISRNNVHVSIDVFDYNHVKLCNLYDSALQAEGQAYGIQHTDTLGTLPTLSFNLPYSIHNRKNFRFDYIKPEYLVRYICGDITDWFILDTPLKRRDSKSIMKTISCSHIASILKTKNLYMTFDDDNGIGTLPYLVQQILRGTGWTFDETHSDTFLESDGSTEKIRSLQSEGRDGALQLIFDVCGLFDGYPVFNGDQKTVTILSFNNKKALREMIIGRDLNSIELTQDSKSLITRMYVEGDYGEDQILGIDEVNPTGLPYLMDFSYYREIGLFTDAHQTALDNYYRDMLAAIQVVKSVAAQIVNGEYELTQLWGDIDFVYYPVVNGVLDTTNYILGGKATADDVIIPTWDSGTTYAYGAIVYYTPTQKYYRAKVRITTGALPTNKTYWEEYTVNYTIMQNDGEYRDVHVLDSLSVNDTAVVRFLLLPAGTIGGKQMGVEAKQSQMATAREDLGKELNNLYPSEAKIAQYQTQITNCENGIEELLSGNGVIYLDDLTVGGIGNDGKDTDATNSVRSDYLTPTQGIQYTIAAEVGFIVYMFCYNAEAHLIDTFHTTDGGSVTIAADDSILKQTAYYRIVIMNNVGGTAPSRADATVTTFNSEYLYQLMAQAFNLVVQIDQWKKQREQALNDENDVEATFAAAMGDMLKEGFWRNTNYVEGQEQALYNDSFEMMSYMCHPETNISIDRVSLANQLGVPPQDLQLNMRVHLLDKPLGINEMFYISKITTYPDEYFKEEVELSNKDINLQGLTLDSVLSRIATLADLIDQKNSLFSRAKSINSDGSILMERLEGMINLESTQLMSAKSSWYTDDDGNIVFVSSSGKSAMMLTGEGWMIANGTKPDGSWNWRTIGTGSGIVADAITAGFLSADRIEARSISAAKLSDDVGAQIDISQNSIIIGVSERFEDIETEIATERRELESQIDKKAETWYQTTDPSTAWTTDALKAEHVGDLWYNSSSNVQKYYRYNGTGWSELTATPPDAVFDEIDGKAQIFVSTPTPPYNVGDLWVQGANGDILKCITAKTSAQTYALADWAVAGKYTDDTAFTTFKNGTYAQFVTNTNTALSHKITTYYQASAPTTTIVGDLWIDTDDSKKLYRWNGNSWENVRDAGIQQAITAAGDAQSTADRKIITFAQASAPTATDVGDLWIETDNNNKLYRWDGENWVAYSDSSSLQTWITSTYNTDKLSLQSQIDNKAETWHQSTDPSTNWTTDELKEQHVGDLWYKTSDQTTWFYQKTINGSVATYAWIQENVPTAVFDRIDGKAAIYVNQPAPPYNQNDLWFDPSENVIKVCTTGRQSGAFSTSDWEKKDKYTDDSALTTFVNGTYATFVTSTTQAINGKITTYYQDEAPGTANTGDLWIDTDNKNQLYRWNGTTWVLVRDAGIQEAMTAASNAQTTADGKIVTFAQTSTPTATDIGDLWINTDDNNKLYRWNGTNWVVMSDSSALNTWLTNTYASDKSALESQIDKKAETWYQTTDPSTAWTTDALKAEHVGDLWYKTSDQTTWFYQKTINDDVTTYAWIQQNVPTAVFNKIDGKAQVFTSQPIPPYNIGDLWVQGNEGDIYKCKTAKSSTQSFAQSDWELASKYTDDSTLTTWLEDTYAEDIEDIYENIEDSVGRVSATVSTHSTSIETLTSAIAEKVSTTTYNLDMSSKADSAWVQTTVESLQTQTAENITNMFQKSTTYTDSALKDYEKLKSDVYGWQTFSVDGMEIGRSDSLFKTRLSNSRLSFLEDGAEIAYISDSSMYITQARVTNTLSVGSQSDGWFDWTMSSKGLSMKWKNA